MKYPSNPKEWNNPQYYLYREFKFESTPDIEILMRLVKNNISDRGNNAYLRARLLGILRSQYSRINKRFWLMHDHPKTWKMRFLFLQVKEYYHRTFKTMHWRSEVVLCRLANEAINDIEQENKK